MLTITLARFPDAITISMTICIYSFLSGCVCLFLFYTISTVFQLYYGGDMMYGMRRRKSEPTLTCHTIYAWNERNWPLMTL